MKEPAPAMQFIADRFVIVDAGDIVDLATGERVLLTIEAAGGPSDQMRWMARCDVLHRLHHPAIAELVDYGALGDSKRFEAWRCSGAWIGSADESARTLRAAIAFLRACNLTVGTTTARDVCVYRGRPVVKLGAAAGYTAPEPSDPPRASTAGVPGIARAPRAVLSALAELFEIDSVRRLRYAAICGPAGSGKTTVLGELARSSRLHGFVPMSVHVAPRPFASLLEGRCVFLIDDNDGCGWDRLIDIVHRSPKPHVVLFASAQERRGVPTVALEPLPTTALVASVRPAALGADGRTIRLAERAGGNPGRFVRLLWRSAYVATHTPPASTVSRVAEQAPRYEIAGEGQVGSPTAMVRSWTTPGDLASVRARMHAAFAQLAQGRHASGERHLRQAVGALSRRGDETSAAEGSYALAASLLKRGRPSDAHTVLDDACARTARFGGGSVPPGITILRGHAWIDLARLDEAESVLRAARAAAIGAPAKESGSAPAAMALARCLFWRGRFVEAAETLSSAGSERGGGAAVRMLALGARVAIGRGDYTAAVGSATDACRLAVPIGPAAVAEAAGAAAFVHLALGDHDALARDVARAVSAARATHDPLRAMRARLMLAESARRIGRRAEAAAVCARLARIPSARLPPIVRERRDLLADLLAAPGSDDAALRRATATGLHALTLFVPSVSRRSGPRSVSLPMDDVLAVVRLCQSGEDEAKALKSICAHLHGQLAAAAVAFFIVDNARCSVIASHGGRLDESAAQRAVAAGILIAPHRVGDRLEGAVPVRFGGATPGALSVRWPLGSAPDPAHASCALTMAATAAAPLVWAAVMARQHAHATVNTPEILGVSPSMSEVRRAIERAAATPFTVLVEGASGCGKELVARALHRAGSRRDRPLCTLNCAALPDDLVESELFGHARGAFTSAVAERAGVFEEAHGGTLFLDEVGELSMRAQAKLLRVIQEGELRRIGENITRRIDVRLVAATNRDLRQETAAGRFRLDLLYRLDVIRIAVPPLRERSEDIPVLAEHFWRAAAARVGSRATLAPATLAALARYDWPGNVRELQNVLAALVVRSGRRGVVPPSALPPQFGELRPVDVWRLDDARRGFEERFIRAALVRTGGRRAQAAAELGMTRQGLTKLMIRLGIEAPRADEP